MTGETHLETLIRSLTPVMDDGTYVFVTVQSAQEILDLTPRMMFHEAEGTTCILLKSQAEAAGLDYEFPCRMITLNVHSSLEAVGFMARITTELAKHGMGVNPVSGFYHDHLFVPVECAQSAMGVLQDMARRG